MNVGEVLKKSWDIIWKFKVLWIFGLLASCGRSGVGGGGGGGQNFNFRNNPGNFSNQNPFPRLQPFLNRLQNFLAQIPVWVYVLIVLAVLIWIVIVIFISTIGRIGLVRGAWLADEGADHLSFGQLWEEGLHYFWRIFLLDLLFLIIGIAIAVILIVPAALITAATFGIGLICLIPLICLLIPISWFITVLLEQSIVAILGENRGVVDGLSRAWNVIKDNFGPMIVMALIILIGNLILGIIIALPALIILIPLMGGIMGGLATGSPRIFGSGVMVAIILLICVYGPIAYFLESIVQTYIGTVWTLTFRRLTQPAVPQPAAYPPAGYGTGQPTVS
ncbi:MAG TPA: hypothetical protein VKF38_00690 [Anaerolineaceae bacterium]|nr:hypothetical protein [Anaerolineaceae bacterium]